MILETNYLPLLDIVSNYSILNIFILRWITYIQILNLILEYIIEKNNLIENILFKARYTGEEEMMTYKDRNDGNKNTYRYLFAIEEINHKDGIEVFEEDLYEGILKDIGFYLSTIKRQEGWIDKTFKDI